jgi:hypothetical protein
MTPTPKDAFKLVYEMLKTRFPKAMVIRANQSAPFPQDKEVVITILSMMIQNIGRPDLIQTSAENGNIDELISGHIHTSLSLNFYTKEYGSAISMASSFSNWLKGSNATQTLTDHDVGLIRISQPRDLSAVVNGDWESRANLDVVISGVSDENDEVAVIENITITSTFIPDDMTAPIEMTNTIQLITN